MACEIVVIGASLGGLAALETILGAMRLTNPPPMVIVQHRMPDSNSNMVRLLQRCTDTKVREPDDREPVERGHIYVAPADYHLLIEDGSFHFSTEGPVMAARPSIDVLFDSAAESYGTAAVAVVLTGASADGSIGAARIKERGGRVIVQEPNTAECGVMPRSALASSNPDWVVELAEIGPLLARIGSNDDGI